MLFVSIFISTLLLFMYGLMAEEEPPTDPKGNLMGPHRHRFTKTLHFQRNPVLVEPKRFLLSGGDFYYMYNEISSFPPSRNVLALRILKYQHFYSPEVTFTTLIMKYQQFLPPGTSFCSTCNEILTFSLSGGDFYYMYNEISTFSPPRSAFSLYV